MYYVYILYKNSNLNWRYVGKGSGGRVSQSKKIRKADRYQIIYRTADENDALRMEDKVYVELKKRNFVMGNGIRPSKCTYPNTSGYKYTEEQKGHIRQARARDREKIRERTRCSWERDPQRRVRMALNNKKRKLTEDQVREIREELKQGVPGHILASRYRVSRNTISWIRLRKIWKHVV